MTDTELEQLRLNAHDYANSHEAARHTPENESLCRDFHAKALVELATLLNSSEFRRQYSSGLASRDGTLKPIVATESVR